MKHVALLALVILSAANLVATGQNVQDPVNRSALEKSAIDSKLVTATNRSFPVLFLVGDSTVHNPSRTQCGWGDVIERFFDTNRVQVQNRALGGRSSRTFMTQGWWEKTLASSKPGDFVILQMGHNDGGPLDDTNRARGTIRGLGEESKEIYNPITKKAETVHTYGWYLRKYIADARSKGLTLILCSPIPHCPKEEVKPGEVEQSDYIRMSAAVAEAEKVPFIPLNKITMSHYAGVPPQVIKTNYFTSADNTHTSPAGAELNARSVVEGLRELKDCKLVGLLKTNDTTK